MPRIRALWLGYSIVLSLLVGSVMGDEAPCTVHADGQYFDLNPLKSRYVLLVLAVTAIVYVQLIDASSLV